MRPSGRLALLGVVLTAGVTVAIVAVVATAGGPTDSESQLLYPGSVVIRRSDDNGFRVLARVEATPEEILAWYQSEVERLGLLDGGGAASISTTAETYACAWHRDDTVLRLSFIDRTVANPELYDGSSSTVYRWNGYATDRELTVLERCELAPPGEP